MKHTHTELYKTNTIFGENSNNTLTHSNSINIYLKNSFHYGNKGEERERERERERDRAKCGVFQVRAFSITIYNI